MDYIESLKEPAKIVIDILRHLSAKGESLNIANLSRYMAQPAEMEALTRCFEKILPERETTAARHPDQEYGADELADFLKAALVTVINSTSLPRGEMLDQALKNLKKELINGADLIELEAALAYLNQACRNVNQMERLTRTGGLVTTPLKSDHEDGDEARSEAGVDSWLGEAKQLYLLLLDRLHLDLDEEYVRRIRSLRRTVTLSGDEAQLSSLRPEIESLVTRYSEQVFQERRQAATFISEVLLHLSELEKHFTAGWEHSNVVHQANDAFFKQVVAEADDMGMAASNSLQLAELKGVVVTRLNTIKEMVNKKRAQDEVRLRATRSELEGLRREFCVLEDHVRCVEEENKTLSTRIQRDPLTGALNRLGLLERLGDEISRFYRYHRIFSLIMVDVDHFKKINDMYGHFIGDNCLIELVRRLAKVIRESDSLARYGGEEFVVLLPETRAAQGREVGEKLRKEIEGTKFTVKGETVPVTISLGLTEIKPEDAGAEQVIQRADNALYHAKSTGRNRVAVS